LAAGLFDFLSLERLAVALALLYVFLAIKQLRSCWIASILSSATYIPIFAQARLYTEACLQLFFIAVSYYGWRQWRAAPSPEPVEIFTMSAGQQLKAIVLTGLIGAALGLCLRAASNASLPFIDSQITCFSITATYLQARKYLENWIYWVVIDLIAACVYLLKELYLTAGLYALFVVLAWCGLRQWRRALA